MTGVGGGDHTRCGEAAARGVLMEDVTWRGRVGAEPPAREVAVDVWT
jgi:hypothetical protein